MEMDNELIDAVRSGSLEKVQSLYDEKTVHNLNFLLTEACWSGSLEVVQFLVEKGADVTARDNSALNIATRNGYSEIVKFLVEKGATVNGTAQDDSEIVDL